MTVLLVALIGMAFGILIGWLAKRDPRALARAEREELEAHRSTREELIEKASEHATLGDHFAAIALGLLTDKRYRNRK